MKIEYDMSEVYKGLDKLSKETQKATQDTLKDVTVMIANDVIKGSPVLTGNNRRSIRYIIKKLMSEIFSTSGYGGYLETGHMAGGTRVAAHPYFKPALDKNMPKFAKIMKEKMRW